MASNGNLQYYLPAQMSQPSTPTIPLLTAGQQTQQQQNSGLPNIPSLGNTGSGLVNQIGAGLGFGTTTNLGAAAVPGAFATNTGLASNVIPGAYATGANAGLGSAAVAAPTTGVPSAGALGTTTSLSSTLGAAGIGAFAGNYLGKIGGNSTGGQIGGAIGGAAGSIAAGTATGAAIGAGLGIGAQALNFVLPGLGIIAGGIIGGFFGGKKKPNPASLFLGKTGGDEGVTNPSYGSKHMDNSFAQGLEGDFANYVKTLRTNYGIDIGGQDVFGGSDKGRTFIRTIDLSRKYDNPYGYAEDSIFDFDPNDPNSKQKAYNSLAVDILKRKNMYTPELEKQINEVGTVAGAQKTIAAQNLANGRSAEGTPLVAAKKDSKALSFAEYATQHNQGRWS